MNQRTREDKTEERQRQDKTKEKDTHSCEQRTVAVAMEVGCQVGVGVARESQQVVEQATLTRVDTSVPMVSMQSK